MYNYKKYAWLSLTCLLIAMLLSLGQVQKKREALADRLAPSMLRFHILANSDSETDQAVKLEVRSLVLDYMQSHLEPDAGKESTVDYLSAHRADVERLADDYLKERGFHYRASLELTNCYFPSRVYDNLVFPCGYYDAARIILGSGSGHNWWCVLYPRLCFVDAACSEVPDKTRRQLEEMLNQGDYLALQDNRPEIQIRFKFFPFLNP